MGALACIILAAGHGTRMKSARPKVLHTIGHRPMLHHVMALGQALGADRQTVVVGSGAEAVADAARAFDSEAAIAVQDPPQGTGHAVQMALPSLEGFEGTVLVLYADTPLLTPQTLSRLIAEIEGGAAVSVLGFEPADPGAYGRLIRRPNGDLDRIVEYKDATETERASRLCNAGLMAVNAVSLRHHLPSLSNDNAQKEYYLTDLPQMAVAAGGRAAIVLAASEETQGVNNRAELAAAEATFQRRLRLEMMLAGVTLEDPDSTYFAFDTQIAEDVTVAPHVVFGPGVRIAANVRIEAFSHIEGAVIEEGAVVGPFARLRPGTSVGAAARVGNFVETKNTSLGRGAKASHLTYLGDAEIGAGSNIGAGTITCNYDGYEKHRTLIGENCFVGSNSSLVAPVTIGAGAYIGSGSVITKTVEPDSLAVARGRQLSKAGWAASYKGRMETKKRES